MQNTMIFSLISSGKFIDFGLKFTILTNFFFLNLFPVSVLGTFWGTDTGTGWASPSFSGMGTSTF